MTEISRRPSFAAFVSAVNEPQIVLAALVRLRWLAVFGQLAATVLAMAVVRVTLPLGPIIAVILVTAVSNAFLAALPTLAKPPAWLVQAVLLLDVLLLTILLYLTGGPDNPFASLYLIHVAMAVIVLRAGWTWLVVATVAACYAVILRWNHPMPLTHPAVRVVGNWSALVLVSVLTATFIGRIIRSLRQREHELTSVRERAAKSEQLAALTTLAAGAAHELNTPLGTIAIVARELELSCNHDRDQEVLDDARLIRREVERCRTILSRMRVDIGEETSQRASVSFDQLEKGLRESLGDQELPRLKVVRDPKVEAVPAPPRAIEQALLVLVRNAFDASPATADVTLKVERRDGKYVRFEVRDAGTGMSEEMLRRAGEPFFTTKEPGRGMGLGLFLVRLVAQQCGATFTIDSKQGTGTTCVLELPPGSGKNGGPAEVS
jgi:two-component system, sensor histidine kinase RegB